jgi:hypothetical protein
MRLLTVCVLLLAACSPGPILDGGLDDSSSTDTTDGSSESDEIGLSDTNDLLDTPSDEYQSGEMWGPCPIDEASGTITLCTDEGVACVPSQGGTMCLPIGECPPWPGFSTHLSMGWGYACYPRCESDADCAPGMACDISLNFESMCSWPSEPDCAGSLGCECENGACAENLNCVDDLCVSCPVGQVGCTCQQGDICDVDLTCVDGTCEF